MKVLESINEICKICIHRTICNQQESHCELWQRLPDKCLSASAREQITRLAEDIGASEIIDILNACAIDSGSGNQVEPVLDSIRQDVKRLERVSAIQVKATKNDYETMHQLTSFSKGYNHGHSQGEQLAYSRALLIIDVIAERLSRQGGN